MQGSGHRPWALTLGSRPGHGWEALGSQGPEDTERAAHDIDLSSAKTGVSALCTSSHRAGLTAQSPVKAEGHGWQPWIANIFFT